MKNALVAILVSGWLATGQPVDSSLPIFGRVGEQLRGDDIAAIRKGVGRGLLAIEAHRGQVLPETWTAVAYVEPESTAEGVRLGRRVELESLVRGERALRWHVTEANGRYAQVALAEREFPQSFGSQDLHRPFKLTGRFTASQIREIVKFVRSSPQRPPIPDDPDGTSHVEWPNSIDGRVPLVQLERIDDTSVSVWLAESFYSGVQANLHYVNGQWRLGQVTSYFV